MAAQRPQLKWVFLLSVQVLEWTSGQMPASDDVSVETEFKEALVLLESGRYAAAEAKFQELLVFPVAGARAAVFANLGTIYLEQGRFLESERYYQQAIAIWQQNGTSHPIQFVKSLTSLSTLYIATRQFSRAADVLDRAARLSSTSSDTAVKTTIHLNRAVLLRVRRKTDAAIAELERAVELLTPLPLRTQLGEVFNNLCVYTADLERTTEAVRYCTRAKEIYEQQLGFDHPKVTEAMRNLAVLHAKRRKYAEAHQILDRCLEILHRAFGPGHFRTGEVLVVKAAVLRLEGRSKEAKDATSRAMEISRAHEQANLMNQTVDLLAFQP